ncbi:MAG: DUF1987 domain-containing protein [Bacteroidetes bacterium]|nr:DUF1987 domain-containing protein [Bacteroidota bacterium]MBK9673378.1 DUF1987 domain-containing protein [Bacteroidota bacterium]MBK9799232.1 DUF1987 domain-containing protein [Bacteroidota bacterium]
MQALFLKQTDFTPLVNFDLLTEKFEIKGESRPENTGKFYAQLTQWLEDLKKEVATNSLEKQLVFDFKFDYFNSTSAKYILDLLAILQEINNPLNKVNITVRWHYDKLDEDMRESGEEFSHLVSLPFEFIVH